jgi:transcriptional regulator with XRE-family HTH domain
MPGRRKFSRNQAAEQKASQLGLGRAVVRLRERAGLSQAELVRRSDNLTPQSLAAIERGDAEARWSTLRAIAGGLEVEPESLLRLGIEIAPGDAGERLRERDRKARTATLNEKGEPT